VRPAFFSYLLGLCVCCGLMSWTPPLRAQTTDEAALLDSVDARLIKRLQAQTGADKASLFQALGFSYFRQEEFDRAFLYFNAAVGLNPRLYWSWYYMGLLNLEDAEEYFKKAIVAERNFAPAYYWLGRYYGKHGRTEEAIRTLEKYLEISWSDPNEHARMDEVQELLMKLRQGEKVE
jgi:tetratricopeptide (TPR) repeat protein